MLIVVVIIGILAAALIPRLQTVQGRARDTKRKADVTQIGSALAVYASDFGNVSSLSWSRETYSTWSASVWQALTLSGDYITQIPFDQNNSSWSISGWALVSWGAYWFTALSRNAIWGAAFAVTARTETDGALSNWITSGTNAGTWGGGMVVFTNVDYYENTCKAVKLTNWAASILTPGGNCTANRNSTDLRYNYIY